MVERHIVPVAPANNGDPVVVVEVKQNGSRPLDVRLVGCEGENPYVTTIQQRSIGNLKNKKTSSDEWETALSYFLLQKQPEGDRASILEGVRMEYTPSGDNIQITIRRDVQGIKMTLGEFELKQEGKEELDPIDWAYTAAQAHNAVLADMASLKSRVDNEQSTIDKLNAQLEEFVKAKEETETAMLQQFMALLNEKKRKVRDQSRLLAGAKVDKSTAIKVQSAREETKSRKAGPSRASKRKAPAKAASVVDEGSDADQMEIDEAKVEEQDEDSGPEAATPDRSDDETEDDASGTGTGATVPVLSSQLSNRAGSARASNAQSSRVGSNELPPKRELPFGRPNTRGKPPAKGPPPTNDGDETEDDEEL